MINVEKFKHQNHEILKLWQINNNISFLVKENNQQVVLLKFSGRHHAGFNKCKEMNLNIFPSFLLRNLWLDPSPVWGSQAETWTDQSNGDQVQETAPPFSPGVKL